MSAQPQDVTVLDRMPPEQGTAMAVHANPYLGMIESVLSRGGDLVQVDKLLDLQIKWEANEARKAYVAAMAAFKAEPMEILKRKLVSFETNGGGVTSYMHAELSDVTDVVVPTMGKHGLSHRWDVTQAGAAITVVCTITHALGHSESVSMTAAPDASGKKNAIQQVASTITYLERYTLLAATGMATKGMDDDGRAAYEPEPEPVDAKAADWIKQCSQVQEPDDLAPLKAKIMADYGGVVRNIPGAVKQAFVDRKAAVMPKDEEA
ncbi:ERF family protein [Lysobacter koreensis]|uniref:ERF family protein n=1 Tax=Lysobacter koreensis TaxID=266122 RepID=A0ABW2YJX1_9GAMM